MGFPLQKTVSAGTIVRMGRIVSGNLPEVYTITATAAAVNATSISLQANKAVYLQHEEVLDFGGVKVEIDIPDSSTGLSDGILVGTSATVVPCKPLVAAVTASDLTATTFALRQLLGIDDASPSEQPQSVDTTDMKSGFGVSNVIVGVNRQVTVSGFKVQGDRAMFEIVMPYLTTDDKIRELLYVEHILPNGDTRKGACRITDGGGQNQVRNPLKYNLTLMFEGNSFQFIDGDTALFEVDETP